MHRLTPWLPDGHLDQAAARPGCAKVVDDPRHLGRPCARPQSAAKLGFDNWCCSIVNGEEPATLN